MGVRICGNTHVYTAAMFAGNGIVMASYAVVRRGFGGSAGMMRHWQIALVGGLLSYVSYGIVISAMTVAPIAMVAALRETSLLFGALIAVIVLREPLRAVRLVRPWQSSSVLR
jgi:drug/metabolite transporter (DMT)-like permease